MKIIRNVMALAIGAANAVCTAAFLLSAYSPYIQPTIHPLRSCLGLAFPIFLLANVCFLLFWLVIQRYRLALLPLAGMLLAYPQIRTYLPVNFHTDHLPEGSLKILSYNVMGFDGCVKKDGKNPILTYLQNSKADILCLQEYATSDSHRHLTQKDIERALKAYPYHHISKLGDAQATTNRMAIFSKYPVLSVRQLKYQSDYNGSFVYELKIGKDTVTIINNHLESNKLTKQDKVVYEDILSAPEREKVESGLRLLLGKLAEASAIRAPQADAIAQAVKQSRHPSVIVCGDFNDTPLSYAYHRLSKGRKDSFKEAGKGFAATFAPLWPLLRIDYILFPKEFSGISHHTPRINLSDHYPVIAETGYND